MLSSLFHPGGAKAVPRFLCVLMLSFFVLAPSGCGEDSAQQPQDDPEKLDQPQAPTVVDYTSAAPWLELGESAHYEIEKPYMQALYLARFIPQYLQHGDSQG